MFHSIGALRGGVNGWAKDSLPEGVIERELWQVREIEEAIADDEANPDEGMTGEEFEAWMIAQGLTTREALERAATRLGR